MGSYVGIDLHRRRSVIVVMDEAGETLSTSRIDNDPCTLAAAVAAAGPEAEVAVEATWGWYWAAEVIAEAGGRMHLAHPLGIKGFENRRVKNDVVDATLLADLLRMGPAVGTTCAASLVMRTVNYKWPASDKPRR